MRSSYTRLYIHLIWGTWDRLPLITPEIESSLYAGIAKKCYELKCTPLAIGGIADHVHLLVRLHAATSVSLLAKEVKGSSSHLVTHVLKPGQFFKWQGSYGAVSCREQDIPRLKAYVENQRVHHNQLNIEPIWETVEDLAGEGYSIDGE